MPNSPPSPSNRGVEIRDVRDKFARKEPQTAEDIAAAQAFIEGKIEMVRHDPKMTEAEKTAAIADLEAQRPRPSARP